MVRSWSMCRPTRTPPWPKRLEVTSALRWLWPSGAVAPWLLALVGFSAMYLPTYWAAANGLWQSDDFGHGPIILAIAMWLFWQVREKILLAPARPSPALGWPLLGLGLLFYAFGRILTVTSVEFLSQILVVMAVLLLLKGPAALRAAWFAVFYLAFMVRVQACQHLAVELIQELLRLWVTTCTP